MAKFGVQEAVLGTLVALSSGGVEAKTPKASEAEAIRGECARAGYQARVAIIKALYDDRANRFGVEIFADASAELTEKKCLEDKGLKPKK